MDHKKLSCVRYSLILFNFTFLAFGLMITLFSIFGLKCNERLLKILYEFNPDIKTIRKCFAINGFLIIINSLFGLTAIYRKRLSILIAFCFILIGLFVFTLFSIVVGTISYHNLANQSPSRAVDTFSGLMNEYDWKGINNSSGRLVDEFQLQFNCCGSLNGSHSWEPLRPTGVPIGAYPLSCCLNDVKYDLDNQWCDEQQVYQKESCVVASHVMVNKVSNYLQITVLIAIETAIVQLLCIICIFLLRSQPIDRSVPLI